MFDKGDPYEILSFSWEQLCILNVIQFRKVTCDSKIEYFVIPDGTCTCFHSTY